ncbi:MAG: PAS domain S-box protein [Owenweeksia sp.]
MLSPTSDHSNYDQTIFDLTPFPMWIYDLKTFRFLAVNKEAIRHYGYSEKEFLHMTIKDIRPKEDIPKLEKAVKEAISRTESYKESLFRHQKRDGSIIYVKIKSNLINYRGKKADIVTAIDLSERYEREKKIETQKEYLKVISLTTQLLLKSKEWLQALYSCFKIVGETIDVDRIYYFQNDPLQPTTSQKIEWTQGHIEPQIDNPELQNISLSQFPLFMEPLKKQMHFEAIVEKLPPSSTKNILKEQQIKSILVLPLWINDNFCGFIGLDDCKKERRFSEDEFQLLYSLTSNLGHIIKQHEAYQELYYSEARFKSLIENGKDLIAIVDGKGDYQYVAPTSKAVLGISPEEFIGKNAFDFIYEEDVPRLKQKLGEIFESRHVSIEPYRFTDANGNWRWIRTELTNHLNTPLIEGIVANTQEVTTEVKKRRIDDLVAVLTSAIGQPGTLSSCLNQALSSLVKLSKISVSEIWLVSQDAQRLDLISSDCGVKGFSRFYQNSKDITSFEKGTGFPGHIWSENKTMLWKDLSNNEFFHRSEAARSAHLNTAIGLPIHYNNEFLGCIICFSQFTEDELSEEVNFLSEVTQQLGAVIKQKITEEEYRNFFNISPDPHCIIGFDGYIKKHNKAFQILLGYDNKKLRSTPIFHFIHEDDVQESQERLKASIHGDTSNSFEARFVTNKGDIKWLIWSGTVIRESKIIIAVAKDTTEQRLAKEELQAAYKRLKTAQKIAKLGYWVRNFDSEVSIWSEEAYHIYEYTPQEFTPTMANITKTFHPDDRYLMEDDPTEHLEPGKVQSVEHRILTGTGKVKWVKQEIRLLTDEHGTPFRIEGTVQDITERKEYEEQLSLSNERFKLAMQASNEMIWEIDHQKQIITRGTGYEQTFNYDTSETLSKENSWFSKIHPDDREEVWNTLQEALNHKNKTFWTSEYKVQPSEGAIAYFMDRCYILRDENGKPVRSVGSALDVTSSRQQLEQIKIQNKNLREIAWLQSHVIRAPLSRIMGLIYLANELDGGGKSKDEIMKMIADSAHELDDVIHKITDKTNLIKDEGARNITD